MKKEEAIKKVFKRYKRKKMKGMIKDYAKMGIIEEEWEEIEKWSNEIFKETFRKAINQEKALISKTFIYLLN